MTTEAGNKIIAEFMGTDYTNRLIPDWAFRDTNFDIVGYGAYKYHLSFDWIMPVVDKIGGLHRQLEIKRGDLTPKADVIFRLSMLHAKIETVWKAVIYFIEWYNNQQLNQTKQYAKEKILLCSSK